MPQPASGSAVRKRRSSRPNKVEREHAAARVAEPSTVAAAPDPVVLAAAEAAESAAPAATAIRAAVEEQLFSDGLQSQTLTASQLTSAWETYKEAYGGNGMAAGGARAASPQEAAELEPARAERPALGAAAPSLVEGRAGRDIAMWAP